MYESNLLIKKESDWDCRAISESFLNQFSVDAGEMSLFPFLKLVHEHKELAIGFRGNNYKDNPINGGMVIIYRNNHAMFTIKPKTLLFNPNYLRYYPDWNNAINTLVEKYGFNQGRHLSLGAVKRSENSRTKVVAFSCSFEKDSISVPISKELLLKVDELYFLFTDIFDAFFSEEREYEIDQFLDWGNKNDPVYKGKVIFKKKKIELEKIRQQQLFDYMKSQTDGYFFYDMEFEQKHKSADDAKIDRLNGLSNKPDMQAIHFDSNGKPQAWVFVEVKCTESAYGGKSSLKNHIKKMRKYVMEEENLKRRRREAYMLLHQYNKLGLLELNREIDISAFENMDAEIIIIFTDDAIDKWVNDADKDIILLKKKQRDSLGVEFTLEDNTRAILVKDM